MNALHSEEDEEGLLERAVMRRRKKWDSISELNCYVKPI